MYVSYRKPVGLLAGMARSWPVAISFERARICCLYLSFTTVPATKSGPTPIFTSPNHPLGADLDQIGDPELGADWEPI